MKEFIIPVAIGGFIIGFVAGFSLFAWACFTANP